MATRVLILGGTSYVAQFLCACFLDGSLDGASAFACTVRSADAQSLPLGLELATTEASSPKQRVVRVFTGVSLLELETVRAAVDAFSPTVVVNCIALSSPSACERDPARAFALNHPSELIAFLSGREKPLHYFHFSTDFVYDDRVVPPLGYRETDAAVSTVHCVYSSTKLAFDEHLLSPPPHLRVTILRIANVVGGPAPLFPDQPPKFAQWLFAELLLASPDKLHSPVRLWKDEVRSFLFVEDLVRVLWRLVRTPGDQLQATARVLNIGGVDAMSRVEFAERLVREYQSLYTAATNTCRPIERAERASVDLGYQSPLDARMDCSALRSLLPDWAFSTTDEIMRELCRLLHSLQV